MRSIFNLYSTFNALFNIQLPIQHSTIHFIFNSSFTHSIIYSTVSTIYSTFNFNSFKHSTVHSTFNFSFNSFEPSLLLVSDATEIGAYEDDFDVESDLPRFLDSVLQRTDQISQTIVDDEIVEQHIVVNEMVRLLCIL